MRRGQNISQDNMGHFVRDHLINIFMRVLHIDANVEDECLTEFVSVALRLHIGGFPSLQSRAFNFFDLNGQRIAQAAGILQAPRFKNFFIGARNGVFDARRKRVVRFLIEQIVIGVVGDIGEISGGFCG